MNTAAAQTQIDEVRLEDVHPCANCGARPLGVCADLKGHELQSMACASETVTAQLPGGRKTFEILEVNFPWPE